MVAVTGGRGTKSEVWGKTRDLFISCGAKIQFHVFSAISDLSSHHSISTLGARQHQAGVGHVVAQVDVCPPAQYPPPFLQGDVRFYGNSVGANYGPVGSSLTLDFATFSISADETNNRENSNVIIE